MSSASNERLARRRFIQWTGIAGLITLGAACSQPSPTAAPAKPTAAPAKPTTAAAKPTAAPAKPTTAPAKPTAAAATKPAATAAAKPATQAPPKLPSLTKFKMAEPSPLFESAFREMALEKGFWRDLGLDVEVQHIASGTTILQGIAAGEIDAGILGSSPIYPAIANGAAIKLTGSFMPGFFYNFYVRPEINDWKDLEGKRVGGGAPGALLNALGRLVLETKGVDFDKVQYVNIGGSPDVYKAITADKIDGGVSGLEFSKEAEQTGDAKSLGDLNDILPNYLRLCHAASDKTLKDKPEVYTAYFYGQMQGHRYALTHKQEVLDLATKITGRDSSELGWAVDYYVSKKVANPNADVDPKKIDYMIDVAIKLGDMKSKIPATQVLDDTTQKKVVAMLGKL